MTTDKPLSPDGKCWWNGEKWLPTTPPPPPRSSGAKFSIIVSLVLVIIFASLIVIAKVQDAAMQRKVDHAYCEEFGQHDPDCP